MCGIFGFVGPIDPQLATYCTNTLGHRGPDGMGLWQGEGITLGHRRLAIMDLSPGGHQPMLSASGRYVISYNGEVYNFVELQKKLESLGYRFRSHCDTEVVINAFEAWGENALHAFNGNWTFVIWDTLTQKLFIARDRFGRKPFFYTFTQNGFAFASEMKALFPLLSSVNPNLSVVSNIHKTFTLETTEECAIHGIKRFPASHFAWITPESTEVKPQRWWCTLDHLPSEVPRRYEDQVAQFRELFIDACRVRMRSDVPLGTALSGGLDSSATMAVMAQVNASSSEASSQFPLSAFVCSFPGTPFDETHFAKKVIERSGVQSHILEIDPREGIPHIDEYYYLFEELYITSLIPFMLTYGNVKKQGVSVTLDGHAGDELLAGYPIDQLDALKDCQGHPLRAYSVLNTYYDCFPKDSPQFSSLPSKWSLYKQATDRPHIKQSRDMNHPLWASLGHLNQSLYVQTHESTLPTLLRNYDRLSMSNGVEIRMPFLDWRLVTYCFALPWQAKIRKGYSKAILRDAMSEILPTEITRRKSKIGWSSPIVDWIKGPLQPFIQDMIHSQDFRESSIVDGKSISEKMTRLIQDPNAQYFEAQDIWTLLTPYLWEKAVVRNWRIHADRAQKKIPAVARVESCALPLVTIPAT